VERRKRNPRDPLREKSERTTPMLGSKKKPLLLGRPREEGRKKARKGGALVWKKMQEKGCRGRRGLGEKKGPRREKKVGVSDPHGKKRGGGLAKRKESW